MGKTTKNFADVIRAKLAQNGDLAELVEQESFNAEIAEEIYRCRSEAGLTQTQLAALAGTSQSVIARVESADYEGHSLSLLRRIAAALNRRLGVSLYRKPYYSPSASKTATVITAEIEWSEEWTIQDQPTLVVQ